MWEALTIELMIYIYVRYRSYKGLMLTDNIEHCYDKLSHVIKKLTDI